jgi:hypothetical protein
MITNTNNTLAEIDAECKRWITAAGGKPYLAEIEIRASRNDCTGEVTVKGLFSLAPDATTVILYPVSVYRYGHWNKTQVRKQMAEVKRELLAKMEAAGYSRKLVNRPIEMVIQFGV